MSKPKPRLDPNAKNVFEDATNQREVLGMLCGAASVAWDDKGVFMSDWATKLVDMAEDKLARLK